MADFEAFIKNLKATVDAAVPGANYRAHGPYLRIFFDRAQVKGSPKGRTSECVTVRGAGEAVQIEISPAGKVLSVSVSNGVKVYGG